MRILQSTTLIVLMTMAGLPAMAMEQRHDHEVASSGAKAHAVIKATDPASSLTGDVHLQEKDGGLQVEAEVFNVPGPGKHGFHIHENGSCEDQGKAAGGHYNPLNVNHGFLPKDGQHAAHLGDMGSIEIDDKGYGKLSVFLPGVGLSGEHSVSGRSVIIHEKADDFSQPTGNAGGRIGCGIIEAEKS